MIGYGLQMPFRLLEDKLIGTTVFSELPDYMRKRSSQRRSRAAASSVGEFLPSDPYGFVKKGTFIDLNLFDCQKMITLLGIFNFLGFVFVMNIVPYQKSVLSRHTFLVLWGVDIVIDSFIVRGIFD